MRTTLTLDDDVARRLEAERRRSGKPFRETFRELVEDGQVAGPLVMEAFLAALAQENGATLATTDRDFARFPKLKTTNPAA